MWFYLILESDWGIVSVMQVGRTLEELKDSQKGDSEAAELVASLQAEIEKEELVKTLLNETRELHSAIGRFGKVGLCTQMYGLAMSGWKHSCNAAQLIIKRIFGIWLHVAD